MKKQKVYVIKRDDGKYYKRYFDSYVEFVENINWAESYLKQIGAEDTKDFITRNEYRFGRQNLQIVPITIIEGNIEEHDKQVRNELIDDIEQEFTNYLPLRNRTGAGFYGKLNEIRKKYEELNNDR